MSNHAITWAYEQHVSQCGAKFVLVALADYADENGFCYPSQETLAKMTSQKERTVRAHLKQLEADGFLKRERRRLPGGKWTSDGYQLQAPQERLRPHQPAAKSAAGAAPASGKKLRQPAAENCTSQRQYPPVAKSAADPLIGSDDPSVDPPSDPSTHTHEVESQPARAREAAPERAPPARVCVNQKFSLKQLRRYARNQSPPLGEGWINITLREQQRTGTASEQVRDWYARQQPPEARAAAPAKPDVSACLDCGGTGFYYPAGHERGVAKCAHKGLLGALVSRATTESQAEQPRGSPAAVG